MKKLIIILTLASLTFFGCQEQNSPLEPEINDNTETLAKNNNTGWDSFFSSFGLESSFDKDEGFSMKSKTYTISGDKGGTIVESYFWQPNGGDRVSMSAVLTIPAGAFEGTLTFDITFDLENLSVELTPSPFTFKKPVLLDLTFWGVDLTDIDRDNVDFVYFSKDGSSYPVKYSEIKVYPVTKYLSVEKAELPHFSRYGWTR